VYGAVDARRLIVDAGKAIRRFALALHARTVALAFSEDEGPSRHRSGGHREYATPSGGPILTEEQIRAATGITTHGIAGMHGLVTVCDNPSIQSRAGYIAYVTPTLTNPTGTLYMLDASTGSLTEQRALTL
jgi:hypothetical protein